MSLFLTMGFVHYRHLISTLCKGGDSGEKSLSLFITANGNSTLWTLFSSKMCLERQYRAYVNGNSMSGRITHIPKVKQTREITKKSLDLEPTCSEVERIILLRKRSNSRCKRNL